jgi:hypothetical protein
MKVTILSSLLLISSLATATAQSLPQTGVVCGLMDIDGNRLAHSFAPNSPATGINKLGTLIETGYSRNNVAPPYKDGRYPFWSFQLIGNGITIFSPQDTPEWKMIFSTGLHNKFPVILMKGGSLRASGDCVQFQQQGTPS